MICGGRFLDKQINCYLFDFDSMQIKHKLTAGFLRWVLLYIVIKFKSVELFFVVIDSEYLSV
jgi:hypothetical protein